MTKKQSVAELITEFKVVAPSLAAIIVEMRSFVFSVNDQLCEEVKYGGLIFMREKELVGGMFLYKGHMSFEFSKGFSLDDPDGILEGKGKFRRHIKIFNKADVKEKKLKHFITQAVQQSMEK